MDPTIVNFRKREVGIATDHPKPIVVVDKQIGRAPASAKWPECIALEIAWLEAIDGPQVPFSHPVSSETGGQ
jgi:hypothetical protein